MMTKKEAALLDYLEFNLIGLVESLKPHLKDDANLECVYLECYKLHKDIRTVLAQTVDFRIDAD